MSDHKHREDLARFCPKCGERVIAIMDDVQGKEIEKCSKCSYRKEKEIKKSQKD